MLVIDQNTVIKVIKIVAISCILFFVLGMIGAVHQSVQQSKKYDASYQQLITEIYKASQGGK